PEAYGETPPPAPASAPGAPKPGGTSHLCVVDGEGNAVALTTTVNGYFGAKVVTRGGVVLNNQIDDFTIDPAEVNMFGLTQSEANLVGPGKRPLSSMTPLLVFDASGERVVGCAGGSGGPRIISHTVAAVLGAWLFDQDAHTAIASPRVHHQWSPDRISADVSLAPDVRAGLTKRGHVVVDQTSPTAVQIIKVLPDGVIEAASDPRKGGLPAAP
ncbi:MAG: gamma-glutamyltransferase family protein, partial [Deltaproteobacteria bacterium]|nr:gamma-glutamyltransferase family protein [Kofleriaceae bacterium]